MYNDKKIIEMISVYIEISIIEEKEAGERMSHEITELWNCKTVKSLLKDFVL